MIQSFNATTEIFLANLALSQQRASRDLQQMSSGYRVTTPSDAPSDAVSILQIQNKVTQTQQTTLNLTRLKGEVDTGEATLATAVTLLQNANVLAAQALGPSQTKETFKALALQVQDIQQEMVGLSQANAEGRFIFSGDNDSVPQFTLNPANTTIGVTPNASVMQDTRQISDIGGTFTPAVTAQDIFNHWDTVNDIPASDNVFAALQALYNGLTNNDQSMISSAVDNIKSASTHVNL